MRMALGLAERGLGQVSPNPSVGCVLVSPEGMIVGRGWTQPGGRPHAETEALARAGERARGATAYVTLEPCSHHGQTPPCAEALIAAGIARVVVALEDPDPRVSGRGIALLRDANVQVETGLCSTEAAFLNAGFLSRIRQGRPLVTLKIATTLDGRIATHTGDSKWITGPSARRQGHLLRAQSDAILIGSNTALADDPELTCRLPGLEGRSPVRIIADGRLRLPLTSRLVATAHDIPTWVFTREGTDPMRVDAFRDLGVEVIELPAVSETMLDAAALLAELGRRGLTRVLVEGGGAISAALLASDLVDRLVWFRAAAILGGDALPGIAGLGLERIADMPRFRRIGLVSVGEDVMESYDRAGDRAGAGLDA
ncbi:MAG: bifunctional diaminohydroxyphosphoribosylaminopyrimidine deaminase/5-amino-6-(5-phosphoribosylamino)uracil reductase RibD [Alphaproteobacteria bacterium]|nr:bifunctional diaminohydroxyphosphoribosylaminopyrimidine deaminase/5-amino-6-(5-phosphoribosylamino)uracil reductase RibD [Alphaproteobacteria bacterium]MBU0798373.1 bifunctional diaminohydroxyphosphoribosylaminopyrimidine deaminase/5-amino-6-(5-phosphoribosylamino)uracil reductase RibD [Alphaproteobacteria bacterium]MBU0887812.1 bifunctional diaminohydroxyphosphoribosylaminopyrimidine deaminase/5-amino-6-(5-phosphoribosylamino)uracil reductase RibD [Alphaproteobacteria bacterium]MBU1814965.1